MESKYLSLSVDHPIRRFVSRSAFRWIQGNSSKRELEAFSLLLENIDRAPRDGYDNLKSLDDGLPNPSEISIQLFWVTINKLLWSILSPEEMRQVFRRTSHEDAVYNLVDTTVDDDMQNKINSASDAEIRAVCISASWKGVSTAFDVAWTILKTVLSIPYVGPSVGLYLAHKMGLDRMILRRIYDRLPTLARTALDAAMREPAPPSGPISVNEAFDRWRNDFPDSPIEEFDRGWAEQYGSVDFEASAPEAAIDVVMAELVPPSGPISVNEAFDRWRDDFPDSPIEEFDRGWAEQYGSVDFDANVPEAEIDAANVEVEAIVEDLIEQLRFLNDGVEIAVPLAPVEAGEEAVLSAAEQSAAFDIVESVTLGVGVIGLVLDIGLIVWEQIEEANNRHSVIALVDDANQLFKRRLLDLQARLGLQIEVPRRTTVIGSIWNRRDYVWSERDMSGESVLLYMDWRLAHPEVIYPSVKKAVSTLSDLYVEHLSIGGLFVQDHWPQSYTEAQYTMGTGMGLRMLNGDEVVYLRNFAAMVVEKQKHHGELFNTGVRKLLKAHRIKPTARGYMSDVIAARMVAGYTAPVMTWSLSPGKEIIKGAPFKVCASRQEAINEIASMGMPSWDIQEHLESMSRFVLSVNVGTI